MLLVDAGVAALAGARVWYSILPQERENETYLPAITIQGEGDENEYTQGGRVGAAFGQRQVDSYAFTEEECSALSDAVLEAIGEYAGTSEGIRVIVVGVIVNDPLWETEAELWVSTHFYSMWGLNE